MTKHDDDVRAPRPGAEAPAISSRELLGGGRERVILHNGERYVLRVTSNNRLILTK